MVRTVSEFLENDHMSMLFMVDIGVWAFRDVLEKYPERAVNIGIFEDGMVSVAAGLAMQGFVPTVYGIAPFIVERALEQLKLDFLYQKLGGNFITIGASYDFSKLGYSHYCPEDIQILKGLPGFEIIAPGHGKEFETLFEVTKKDGNPTYFRLSDHPNKVPVEVEFGKAAVIQKGNRATVIAVSTMLDTVMEACKDRDVTVLYYTTLYPFDKESLSKYDTSGKILLCEPFMEGTLCSDIVSALKEKPVMIDTVGVPREVLRSYGTALEKDKEYGLTVKNIRNKIDSLISK